MRVLVAIALLFIAIQNHAQFELTSQLDTNIIRVGEQCILTLSISDVDEPQLVEWPKSNTKLAEQLELVYLHGPDTVLSEGAKRYQVLLYITAWDSGFFALPPIQIGYKGHYEQTEAQLITVNSVPLRNDHEIEDIRPARSLTLTWQEWVEAYWERLVYGALALATLTLLILLLYKHKSAVARDKERRFMAADLKAIRALELLRENSASSTWDKKDYYVELSGIVRRFLEERFDLPALELTSAETLTEVQHLQIGSPWTEQIASLLQRADMVKFAKAAANDEIAELHLEESFAFVTNHRTELTLEDE